MIGWVDLAYGRACPFCGRPYSSDEELNLFLAEALYLKGLAIFHAPTSSLDYTCSVLLSAHDEAEKFQVNRILWKVLAALSEVEERADIPV